MSQDQRSRYWFPAKSFGWGWGFPSTWEGWVVFLVWVGGMAGAALLFGSNVQSFSIAIGVLSALLLAIVWWKGEPPKWRWGSAKEKK